MESRVPSHNFTAAVVIRSHPSPKDKARSATDGPGPFAAGAATERRRLPQALRFPLFFSLAALLSWSALRLALYLKFRPPGTTLSDTVKVFAAGLHADAVMALAVPVILVAFAGILSTAAWLMLAPAKFALPPLRALPLWRWLFGAVVSACCAAGVFLLISEWYFFEEFESRFNCVAIDYLLYPHEVFTNIRESYPVPAIMAACLLFGGLAAWLAFRRWRPHWQSIGIGAGAAVAALLVTAAVLLVQHYFNYGMAACAVLAPAAGVIFWRAMPSIKCLEARRSSVGVLTWVAAAVAGFLSLRPSESAFSSQRVLNELAGNGWASALRAAWTRDLDFPAFYHSLPRGEAFRRARRLLEEPGATFAGPEAPPEPPRSPDETVDETAEEQWLDAARLSLTRDLAGDAARPRLSLCILLEESLGSEFWGVLDGHDRFGHPQDLTPEMDKLSAERGLLFTRILADGNRTIRGFEGVFSSFPPLPGDSILARDKTSRVETIARVLQRDGYQSLFLYGGHGTFDNISSYTLPNGWDRLIEQRDFDNPAHTTAWGVSDEDLYHRGLAEMRALHDSGRPFLVSFMTVSNHRPYTFPDDRIAPGKSAPGRANAVRYADWALGDFFRRAQVEPFWKDTIFAVIADHGARVYGSQTIPLQSYQIPVLLAGGPLERVPRRVDVPGCQLEVAPTLLGLIGRPYRSLFFGHDLLKPGAAARDHSLMHHNRSIAIHRAGRQVVFGLNQTLEYWQGDTASGRMERVNTPDATMLELQNDGAALFTAADALYTGLRYILPE
jgi:membrane-anchored protein YejM (alkaline phosphatase superfamily)